MTKANILQLWKSGIPLSRAWWEFAPVRKQSAPRFIKIKAPIQPIPKEPSQAVADLFALGQRWVEAKQRETDWRKALQASLLNNLEQGELVALGFSIGSQVHIGPTIVPLRLLDGRFFEWSVGEIADPPHKFIRVRINRPNQIQPLESKRRGAPSAGRPTVKPAILEATQMAISNNGEFYSLGRKQQSDEIKMQLKVLDPERFHKKLPSHRTIENFIPEAIELLNSKKI